MKLLLSTALSLILFTGLLGCTARSLKPDVEEVEMSREEADKDCKDMGLVTGTTMTAKGSQDEALANLRKEAAHKGANYVQIREFSQYGTSVTGIAYECP